MANQEKSKSVRTLSTKPQTCPKTHRRLITMWNLMIWAYRDQEIRRMVGDSMHLDNSILPRGNSGAEHGILKSIELCGAGATSRGVAYRCNEDAFNLHMYISAHVNQWTFRILVKHSETGNLPEIDRYLEPYRQEPVMKIKNGVRVPVKIYDENNNEVGVKMRNVGVKPSEVARIRKQEREQYSHFYSVLVNIMGDIWRGHIDVSGFVVTDVGVDKHPWKK